MTVRGLLDFFESYYGEKYTGDFLDVMAEYLSNFSDDWLEALSKTVVLNYPRTYNKSPDPAIIEKHIEEIRNEIERRKIKNALPETPTEKCSNEEAEAYINQMREILHMKKEEAVEKGIQAPMLKSLNKVIDNLDDKEIKVGLTRNVI